MKIKVFKDVLNKPFLQGMNLLFARILMKFFRPYYYNLIDNNKKKAIDIAWKSSYGKSFPWKNPQTLNEKINYLSGISDTSLWTKYADKYEVRQHIKDCGFEDILTKCYGIWERVEDIEWSKLPNSFVIKCTHDCGSTIIIKDKNKELDIPKMNEFYNKCLQNKFGYYTCEPHYTKIKPRIMAEELIDMDTSDFSSSSMVDYKFWGIKGNVPYCMLVYNRAHGGGYSLDLYEVTNWKQVKYGLTDHYSSRFNKKAPQPKNLDKMIEISKKLSENFPIVRIDLYNVNGKIYFGEMTFTSMGGRMTYYTEEFQKDMGNLIEL